MMVTVGKLKGFTTERQFSLKKWLDKAANATNKGLASLAVEKIGICQNDGQPIKRQMAQ